MLSCHELPLSDFKGPQLFEELATSQVGFRKAKLEGKYTYLDAGLPYLLSLGTEEEAALQARIAPVSLLRSIVLF